MTEDHLKNYFDSTISAHELGIALNEEYKLKYLELTEDYFTITRAHILKLCDDLIRGFFTIGNLEAICSMLIASDYFHWDNTSFDESIVATTIFDWDNHEINFPLTLENLEKYKHYLLTGEYTLKA